MGTSFKEKSAWIQLVGLVAALGFYALAARRMVSHGVTDLRAFVPVFLVAVGAMVIVLVAGHIVAAVMDRRTGTAPDERDRLIGWRAEGNASWIVVVGVLTAVSALVLEVGSLWIAHVLMLSLFLSEIAKYALELIYYRRGT